MRLLHSSTLEFHEFYEGSIPPYVILSHTWGNGEISYQDMCQIQRFDAYRANQSGTIISVQSMDISELLIAYSEETTQRLKSSRGYSKIQQTARLATQFGCDYFWVDTCAIDKKSSSELQESINSMFRWYQNAAKCVVHLEDVDHDSTSDMKEQLETCRWVGRGWTLQELIAPRKIFFYDRQWNFIGEKRHLLLPLQAATGIPRHVLTTCDLSQASVAQKMSWAANRKTTRSEDKAYCLLGLFGVHIALLYGEGENAFLRLQEEILRTTPDDSIFAWDPDEDDYALCSGLLATSPSQFRTCGDMLHGTTRFVSSSSLGIRLDIRISPVDIAGEHDKLYVGWLRSGTPNGGPHLILLRPVEEENEYGIPCTRVMVSITDLPIDEAIQYKSVIVRQNPVTPWGFTSAYIHCFHIRRGDPPWPLIGNEGSIEYRIANVWPPQQYLIESRRLLIPHSNTSFVGVLFLERVSKASHESSAEPIQLLLGYDKPSPRYWCKFVRQVFPEPSAPDSQWREYIDQLGPFDDCKQYHLSEFIPDVRHLAATVVSDLYCNRLSLAVYITKLQDDYFD